MNATVKVVLGSVAGALLGACGGYIVTRKVYEKRCQEQVDEIKEYYKEKYEGKKEDDIHEQETDKEVNKESEKKQSKETIVTSTGDDDRPLNNYSKCSSRGSNYIKAKQEDKNVAVKKITKEEFDDYEGDADIYRYCWWYEGDQWLIDEGSYQHVFRQDKDLLKFFANHDWEWDEVNESYEPVYIQLAPGVSGLDDGALCIVRFVDCGYFETDDPFELDNIWVDTGEDCEFGKAAVADIRGDLGSGCYDPDDHKANGAV